MKTTRRIVFHITFCLLVLCFLRDRIIRSGVTVYKRDVNATLVDPGPECLRHKSDTNHRANIARIQRGVEGWIRRVDPHNYTYILNPTKKCESLDSETDHLLLLIFVNSAPDHFLNRNLIRNTFGRQPSWPLLELNNQSMRLIFSLGAVDDTVMQSRINDESTLFGDIVQEDFIDDYLNMTLKTVMGLKWATNFCSRAAYVMKIDDDVLINAPKISQVLREAPKKRFTMGDLHSHAIVRDPKSKWGKFYTPKHLWPSKKFPPFFTGPAYIFSMDVAKKVYKAAMETPLFPWSDVYIGMCSMKAKVLLKNQKGFIASELSRNEDKPLPTGPKEIENYKKLYTTFHIPVLHMAQLWEIWTNRTVVL
ncbi:beta-1,3-galactosyltransferase 1-like [Diadema antillarum]|uniref:beta-1,3-galactosyltransferase 1-like n=1 Tax=Diadema antillarum TaxID=105358 RepID=UPI003A87ADC7